MSPKGLKKFHKSSIDFLMDQIYLWNGSCMYLIIEFYSCFKCFNVLSMFSTIEHLIVAKYSNSRRMQAFHHKLFGP
jgi:hypothetical protein